MGVENNATRLRDRRFAANQTVFRRANERLRRSLDPEELGPELYECECGTDRCGGAVSLLPHEYEHVRSNSKWFLIAPRHTILAADSERIVEAFEHYGVAEKSGAAGDLAAALTTRRPI